ncbi:MAG: HAMP domain-containing protein [Nitrospirae bacterium]|nr:HAMP domain-containing protein [Nitrospirota bacterium]
MFSSYIHAAGLKKKFFITASMVIIFLGLSIGIIEYFLRSRSLHHELEIYGSSIVRHLADSAVDPILTQDIVKLKRLLSETVREEEGIAYAYIINSKGKIVAHSFDNGFPDGLKGIHTLMPGKAYSSMLLKTEKGYMKDFAAPIFNGIGTAYVGISTNRIRDALSHTMWTISLLTALLLVIGILSFNFIAGTLLKPLDMLTRGARKIGEGRYDIRVHVESKDEVGLLASSFNAMAEKLEATISALEDDIKERVRVEEMLRKRERQLTESQKAAMIGSWNLDILNKALDWSDETFRRFDKEPGSVIPSEEYFVQLVHPDDRASVADAIRDAIERDAPYHVQSRIINESGREWVMEAYGVVERDEKGKPLRFLGTAQDITKRKEIDAERERLIRKLKDKTKELEQVVYVVSHDLRSPLVNIEGYYKEVEFSLEDLKDAVLKSGAPREMKERVTEIMDKDIPESDRYIKASIRKMDSLLAGLLKVSRMGHAALAIENLDMKSLISNVILTLEYQFMKAGANYEISELPACAGDVKGINQVFSNLIQNALKYRSAERPCFIKISGHEEGGESVYCVEDNGIGIKEGDMNKIFELFSQIHKGNEGEGLGLNIAKKIVEKHNGRIWAESEYGNGSRFFVALPCAKNA